MFFRILQNGWLSSIVAILMLGGVNVSMFFGAVWILQVCVWVVRAAGTVCVHLCTCVWGGLSVLQAFLT